MIGGLSYPLHAYLSQSSNNELDGLLVVYKVYLP